MTIYARFDGRITGHIRSLWQSRPSCELQKCLQTQFEQDSAGNNDAKQAHQQVRREKIATTDLEKTLETTLPPLWILCRSTEMEKNEGCDNRTKPNDLWQRTIPIVLRSRGTLDWRKSCRNRSKHVLLIRLDKKRTISKSVERSLDELFRWLEFQTETKRKWAKC